MMTELIGQIIERHGELPAPARHQVPHQTGLMVGIFHLLPPIVKKPVRWRCRGSGKRPRRAPERFAHSAFQVPSAESAQWQPGQSRLGLHE